MSEERPARIAAFLGEIGWGEAQRIPLPQDASTRRYERLLRRGQSAILMDAPIQSDDPPCPEDASREQRLALGWSACSRLASGRVEAFVALAGHLRGLGLSAPEILACDTDQGLAVVEDFGEALIAREIENGADENALYALAGETAAFLHGCPLADHAACGDINWPLLEFDALALKVNADLFIDWGPLFFGTPPVNDRVRARWEYERDALIEEILGFPRTLILRDFHAENMVWLPERQGIACLGLLDFQDAVCAPGEWDMAMLLDDARRMVSATAGNHAVRAYLDRRGLEADSFRHRLDVTGTVNALRVAGIFARLVVRDGKPRYRQFQQRQRQILAARLQSPVVRGMAALAKSIIPGLLQEP